MTDSHTMQAARLHGPRDLRVETVPRPGPPGPRQALIRVGRIGICGSDLHSYKDARIGDTTVEQPLILGHEFGGVVESVGADALDGTGNDTLLLPGTRVAVDPAQPCGRCPMCEEGHPNLCRRLHFCGNYPDDGSLAEYILIPAHSCFPIPDSIDDEEAALLEPLGVSLHATDLAKLRLADSVAIIGAGCIGLGILQLCKLAGADPVFVSDLLPWRLALVEKFGGIPVDASREDPVKAIWKATGHGVDVAIEAAWSDGSAQQAAGMARLGGRLVIVGISEADDLSFKHSTVRRKGLTIRLVRRMKHVYPRGIHLLTRGMVDLKGMVSHRIPLARAPEAFAMNCAYRAEDKVVKIVVEP